MSAQKQVHNSHQAHSTFYSEHCRVYKLSFKVKWQRGGTTAGTGLIVIGHFQSNDTPNLLNDSFS